MDYLDYLFSLRNKGSTFGIERMELLISEMDSGLLSFPVIHVAGTNGKGSTCSMLDAIYRENGYSVGLVTSPHLVDLGERIRVNGKILSGEILQQEVEKLKPICQQIGEKNAEMHPSFFEFMTAIAFSVFHQENVDLAIIETGLGGRLDSTNVVKPVISVITTISLDHCNILGDTLEKIAFEKAGIIKQSCPVLTGWLPREANKVIKAVAEEKESFFKSLADEKACDSLPETNLQGNHQKRNAALALNVCESLKKQFPIDHDLSLCALQKVKLEGRWQIIQEDPMIILDACHNAEGAESLEPQIKNLPTGADLVIWFGSLGKERAEEILKVLIPLGKEIHLFQPNQPRACSFEELYNLIPHTYKSKIYKGVKTDILSKIVELRKNQILLITGSIYLLGEILEIVKKKKKLTGANFQDLF